MIDLKKALEKAGFKESGDTQKKCKCGKPIKNPKFDNCFDCSTNKREGSTTSSKIPDSYLKDGYFDKNLE